MDNDVFFFFKPWKWGKGTLDLKESISNNNKPLPRTYKKERIEEVLKKVNLSFYPTANRPSYSVVETATKTLSARYSDTTLTITITKQDSEGVKTKTYVSFNLEDISTRVLEYECTTKAVEYTL